MIALVAAYTQNKVIGRDGKIPWLLEHEKKRFKDLTTGNIVVMGRKTFESIGKPLQDRITIVISSTKQFTSQSLCTVNSFQSAFTLACQLAGIKFPSEKNVKGGAFSSDDDLSFFDQFVMRDEMDDFDDDEKPLPKNIFFAGGASVYKEALPFCDKLFITEIKTTMQGNVFFPDFDESLFTKTIEKQILYDEIPYDYVTYTRKNW
ncbi:MAG: dihydrofolate reductase [Treponema sp.]|nr:dihydrofolate reductase [Treponema sp.]